MVSSSPVLQIVLSLVAFLHPYSPHAPGILAAALSQSQIWSLAYQKLMLGAYSCYSFLPLLVPGHAQYGSYTAVVEQVQSSNLQDV